jgi:hypothetical protein
MTESQWYNCSTSSGGNASCTRLGWSLQVANLPPAVAIDGLITCHGEIIVIRKTLKRTVLTEDDLDDGKAIMKLQIATWNVRGISHKLEEELTKELEERKLDTAIVSETKKKNKGSTDIGSYVIIYSGVPNENWAASGVALLIRKLLRNRILGYTWISPRIIQVKLRIACREFNIIGVYAPVEGKREETEILYTDLHRKFNQN